MIKTDPSDEDTNKSTNINKLRRGLIGYGICFFLTVATLSSFLPHVYLVMFRPEEEWCAGWFRNSDIVVSLPETVGFGFSLFLFITFIFALSRYSRSPGFRKAAPWLMARGVLVGLSFFLVYGASYVRYEVDWVINKRIEAFVPQLVGQFQPGVTTRNDIETKVFELNASLVCHPEEGFLGKRASSWEKGLYQDIQEGLQTAKNGKNIRFGDLYDLRFLGFYVTPRSIDHAERQQYTWNYGEPLASVHIIYYLRVQYDETDHLKKAGYDMYSKYD